MKTPLSVGSKRAGRRLKKAHEEGRTLMFIDESGFYPLPMLVRTYAPRGETPVLSHWLTRDHLSIIGGVTPPGKLYFQVQETAIKGPDGVRFLNHLLRQVPGPTTVLWDRASIHRCQVVKDFLADLPYERLEVELLLAYAPELNPEEGLWSYLKRVKLKNVCSQSLSALRQEIRKATARLRQKVDVIFGCFQETGLYLDLYAEIR